MIAPRTRTAAITLVLVLGLTFLFIKAGSVSPDVHQAYESELRHSRQIDADIDLALMSSRFGLLPHYDPLVSQAQALRRHLQLLDSPPAFLTEEDRAELALRVQVYREAVQRKLDLVERFKSENAVLRNSLAYFPFAADRVSRKSAVAHRQISRKLDGLAQGVMMYIQTMDGSLAARAGEEAAALRSAAAAVADPALEAALGNVLLHAETLMRSKPLVDGITKAALEMPTQRYNEELFRFYAAQHDRALAVSSTYRYFLYLFALLLVAHITTSIIKLRQNSVELARANAELTMRIDERRRTEEELRLYARAFSDTSEAILITDASNVVVAANGAFTRITGYEQSEILGKTPSILRSGRHGPDFYQNMWASVSQTGRWHGEIWNRRRNGEIYPEWLSISAVHNPQGEITNYIALFTDVTEQKQTEERIRYLAHHDALTGLPNRLLLQDRLSQALLQGERGRSLVGVLFVDLDRFKVINDTLGHDKGDHLLRLVAERLAATVRRIDTVSRQGGDEFVIVLPELAQAQDAAHIGQKIVRSLTEPFQVFGHELTITSSIGIALYPNDGRTPHELMRNADTAMYRAKAEGRNNYQFYAANMNAASLEGLVLENQLRRSIERNELVIYFQPKLSLTDGRMTGFEALLRWRHPDLGLVSPAKFIPLAEETGLIVPIGEWVLRSVCREIRRWENAGLPPARVAVNLSAHQFAQENLPEAVALALRENALAPDRLELELTESALMRDLHRTAEILGQLRAMGLHLSVDDFGTGYSSLSYLKQFPIEKLKIDQSFVGGIEKSTEDAAIARAIIALGHSLGLAVIAEGVENRVQYDFLKRQGCDEIQGHYYSAALPPEQVEAFLKASAGAALH